MLTTRKILGSISSAQFTKVGDGKHWELADPDVCLQFLKYEKQKLTMYNLGQKKPNTQFFCLCNNIYLAYKSSDHMLIYFTMYLWMFNITR